jgi:ATP-dependent DNA helicase RecG
MSLEKLNKALKTGENICTEFKRCGGKIEEDTYQTVCSFLNRFGGDIYLGVTDNGTIAGVPEKAADGLVKNFISVVSNPASFNPTVYISPETIDVDGKTVIHIHVPTSPEVHSYKKVVYDRLGESDIVVKGTRQMAEMYIRKNDIFTERRVYKYVTKDDLRLDLLPVLRQMAVNRIVDHPWKSMSDSELLKSAGLYGEDKATGEKGYLLAAVMLLGKDDVIRSIVPAYRTDALLRKVNVDRYDDRVIVQTNLIESYRQLMDFAEKHLLDKFYLENDARVSLRNTIAREMLVNTLMHREFTSTYIAKFIIERDKMYTENANRAASDNPLTPNDFEPNPKNPLIAAFFRNIGLADELGSGVRKLFKYAKRYSGKEPELIDGDVFRTVVPLDDDYSFDGEADDLKTSKHQNIKTSKHQNSKTSKHQKNNEIEAVTALIIEKIKENPKITQKQLVDDTSKSLRVIQSVFTDLQEKGVLTREGAKSNGHWVIKE